MVPMMSSDSLTRGGDHKNIWGSLEPKHGRRLDLHMTKPLYELGRAPLCDIKMSLEQISGKHAILEWDGHRRVDSAVIKDANSLNGTWINGRRIDSGDRGGTVLKHGDVITFGHPAADLSDDIEFIFLYNHAWVEGAHEDAKYAVLDQSVGDGAFARVFAARYNGGQIVAVKVLNRAAILKRARGRCDTAQETFERDMVREAQIHKGLKHPFIVTFIAHRRFNGDCGIVMEYANGRSLSGWMKDFEAVHQRGLCESKAKIYAAQLAEALRYLHDAGIAHRDLKPDNILIFHREPDFDPRVPEHRARIGIAKIADFGVASYYTDVLAYGQQYNGTRRWWAPEVPSGKYGLAMDVFALGLVVCNLLTLWAPFYHYTRDEYWKQAFPGVTKWETYICRMLYEKRCPLSDDCVRWLQETLSANQHSRLSAQMALEHPWLLERAEAQVDEFELPVNSKATPSEASFASFPTIARTEWGFETAGDAGGAEREDTVTVKA